MNQVYFIHLVLARLSLRQAFGVTPNASLASFNDSAPFRASSAATSPRSVLLWGLVLAVWVLASSGCVGTRGGPPPRFAPRPELQTMSGSASSGSARMGAFAMEPEQAGAWDFQPALHEVGYHTPAHQHSLPCRMGLLGRRMDRGGDCSCTSDGGCGPEGVEPQPRESLTLPWLKGGHKSKPPEVSRFLPVPTRPVFQPQTIGW
jgi:hypothetical protein